MAKSPLANQPSVPSAKPKLATVDGQNLKRTKTKLSAEEKRLREARKQTVISVALACLVTLSAFFLCLHFLPNALNTPMAMVATGFVGLLSIGIAFHRLPHVNKIWAGIVLATAVLTGVDAYFTYTGAMATGKSETVALLVALGGFCVFFTVYAALSYVLPKTPRQWALWLLLGVCAMAGQYFMSIQYNLYSATGQRPAVLFYQQHIQQNITPYTQTAASRMASAEAIPALLRNEARAWENLAEQEAAGIFTGRGGEGPAVYSLRRTADTIEQAATDIELQVAQHYLYANQATDAGNRALSILDTAASGGAVDVPEVQKHMNAALENANKAMLLDANRVETFVGDLLTDAQAYFTNLESLNLTNRGRALLEQEKVLRQKSFARLQGVVADINKTAVTPPALPRMDKLNIIFANWRAFLNDIGFAFLISWSAMLLVLVGGLLQAEIRDARMREAQKKR